MSLGPRGRKGSIGTSMNMVRKPAISREPRLRLPSQPKRANFFTRSQINAEAARLRSEGNVKASESMRRTTSWEQALEKWKHACAEAKTAHAEKMVLWKLGEEVRKAKKAEKARKWKETIDYCEANGLPSPREIYP